MKSWCLKIANLTQACVRFSEKNICITVFFKIEKSYHLPEMHRPNMPLAAILWDRTTSVPLTRDASSEHAARHSIVGSCHFRTTYLRCAVRICRSPLDCGIVLLPHDLPEMRRPKHAARWGIVSLPYHLPEMRRPNMSLDVGSCYFRTTYPRCAVRTCRSMWDRVTSVFVAPFPCTPVQRFSVDGPTSITKFKLKNSNSKNLINIKKIVLELSVAQG